MIVFENKPSAKTPINDKNLNANFNEVDKSTLILGLNGHQILTSKTDFEELQLTHVLYKSGTQITQSGNGAKIGVGVTEIDVSGAVYLRGGYAQGNLIQATITKNNVNVSSMYIRPQGPSAESIVLPVKTVSVIEGDIITLRILNQTTTGTEVGDFDALTFLNVKKT